jgi:hypothetical protein
MDGSYIIIYDIPNYSEIIYMRRVHSCRCVAIVISRQPHYREELVCSWHKSSYENLNDMAERRVGILSKDSVVDIIDLESNTILL